jgi:hypothetical protein
VVEQRVVQVEHDSLDPLEGFVRNHGRNATDACLRPVDGRRIPSHHGGPARRPLYRARVSSTKR